MENGISKYLAVAIVMTMLIGLLIVVPNASVGMAPGWTKFKVIDNSGSSNGETSIAVDSNEHVHIAYSYTNTGYNERLWYSTNASGSWVSTMVDNNNNTGLLNSIAVDSNGHVHIAYFDYSHYCVKYATDASGSWVNETVDPSDGTGQLGISLAIDSLGNPHIAYQNTSTGHYILSYAEKVGGSWKIEQVDIDAHGESTGVECSIAVDSLGHSHISYLKNQTLGYATNEGGSWVNTTLDYSWEAGWGSSIAIDGLDHVHISYLIYSFSPYHLMYITDASGSWVNETVGDTWGNTDVVVDSGYHPIILTDYGPTLFTKNDSSWDHIYPISDSVYSPSMVIDSNDKLHVSYSYGGDLYYATNSIATDTTAPTIAITSPTSGSTYSTTADSITISGTCSDDTAVTSITWTNSAGGSGTTSGGSTWSVNIPLFIGSNFITVTAHDAVDHSTSATITVTLTEDTTDPTIAITSPTTSSTYETDQNYVVLGGTASDDVGVTSVTWVNSENGLYGTCIGTEEWGSANIGLDPGDNLITVTAHDAAGNEGAATITVTYNQEDVTDPTGTVTSPTDGSTYWTNSPTVDISGTASDNVGVTAIAWYNEATMASGAGTGTASWSVLGISLLPGANNIVITIYDAEGNSDVHLLTVIFDATDPTIAISSPTGETYNATSSNLTISGTCSDNIGVTNITWVNSRGGSGWIEATEGVWSLSGITLHEGTNVITVTARDASNNTAITIITVNYSSGSGSDDGNDGVIPMAIGGGIALIAILLVLFLFLRRRKKA